MSTQPTITRQDNGNGTFRYEVDGQVHTKASKKVFTHASLYRHVKLSDWDKKCGRKVGDVIVFLHSRQDLAMKGHKEGNGIAAQGDWKRDGWTEIADADTTPEAPAEDEQTCTGCQESKSLDQFGRTSKARGSKPMKRCKDCIRSEAKARRAADEATAPGLLKK